MGGRSARANREVGANHKTLTQFILNERWNDGGSSNRRSRWNLDRRALVLANARDVIPGAGCGSRSHSRTTCERGRPGRSADGPTNSAVTR